jgi:HEAT repeat protein
MTTETYILIEQLHHPDRNVRSHAALTLGKQQDSTAMTALLETLPTEPDFFVREDITWALIRLGDQILEPLLIMLRSEDPEARHLAAHTLGKLGDRRATNALIQSLEDEHPKVVMKAAFTLGQFRDQKAIPALIGLLGHPDREVQTSVNRALEDFAPASIQPLIAALKHEVWQVREQAVDILGLIEVENAVPALIAALEDAHWEVRFAVATALSQIGSLEALEALRILEADEHPRVRELASIILSRGRS